MIRFLGTVFLLFLISFLQAQDTLRYTILKSEQYINQRQDTTALVLLKKYPQENYYYYYLQAKALSHLGKNTEAINALKKVNLLQTDYADLDIAEIYARKGEIDSVYYYLDLHLHSLYKKPYSFIYNQVVFRKLSQTKKWAQFWEKDYYTEEEKNLQQAIYYNSQNKILTALDILDNLIAENKKNAQAYYYRALFTVELNKDYKSAIKDLQKALKIKHEDYKFNVLLGEYYMAIYKHKKALSCFVQADKTFPYNLTNYYNLSEAFYRISNYDKAAFYISYYLKIKPLNKKALFLSGNIYLDAQKNEEAISVFTKGIYQYPRDLLFVEGRGKAYMQNEQYQNAARDFNTAIDLDAQNGALWFLKALATFYQDKKQEACKLWKRARLLNYYQADEYLLKYCN